MTEYVSDKRTAEQEILYVNSQYSYIRHQLIKLRDPPGTGFSMTNWHADFQKTNRNLCYIRSRFR